MELVLGFLADGWGSNVEAILRNIREGRLEATPKVIISSNPQAEVHSRIQDYGLEGFYYNERNLPTLPFTSVDEAIATNFRMAGVNFIVGAGFLKKVGPKTLEAYPNRVANIHPSLLPEFGGKGMYGRKVHEAVLESGARTSGATVHLMNEEYDQGRILGQCSVDVYDWDTENTLAERVLEVEHVLYTRVLRDIQKDRVDLDSS